MKKSISLTFIILIFLVGICTCLYPTISNFINKKNETTAIKNVQKAAKNLSEADLQAEKNAVIAYNKSLVNNHIVLTDPFDPDAFPLTDGKYEELLSLSDAMASIIIPKIGVELPIYHGTKKSTLEIGVGHLENTSLPLGGVNTHAVLSAHTGLPSNKLFSDLDKLKKGDIFYIDVLDERLSYMVDKIKVVKPNNSSDLLIVNGCDYITLVTCTPYGKNTHRLLVRGTRIANKQAKETISAQNSKITFFDYILAKYGISIREFFIYVAIIIMSVTFMILLVLMIRKRNNE